MKRHIPIKRFEYCIPSPGSTSDGIEKVNIDFEKKQLLVTGDIRRVPDRSGKPWWKRANSAGERIEVQAIIHPGFTGGLVGFTTGELIFSLEGTIRDRRHVTPCSGLLILEDLSNRHGSEGREWNATLYLYDDKCDGRELKLRLTMYTTAVDPQLN